VTVPKTRYARCGDLSIAYQVAGDGPLDLVFVPGFVSHVELFWELPGFGPVLRRLAQFSRLILLDKRGTGLSDRVARLPTLEERMDDLRAVMDAVGSERAAVLGISEGGPMAILFAASHPERTAALVLWGSFARTVQGPDYPIGIPPDLIEHTYALTEQSWGEGAMLARIALQDVPRDAALLELLGRAERNSATPLGAVAALRFANETDVRHVLPAITVPTLVVHRTGDRLIPVALGRYLADHIPGARWAELPGDFHVGGQPGANDDLLGEVEEFLTGARVHAQPEADRVLATLLFTDIVGSTERAAALGDRRWRDLLNAHDAAVRRELVRARGREIKTTGDGFLAAFDGPARAIRCAQAIGAAATKLGLAVRAGVHTGECEVRGDDLAGIALHIGARLAALAEPGEILATGTVRDLVVGSGIAFADRGEQTLRGVPGVWRVFAVAG
jgi:class 3 adenylate cyclase